MKKKRKKKKNDRRTTKKHAHKERTKRRKFNLSLNGLMTVKVRRQKNKEM